MSIGIMECFGIVVLQRGFPVMMLAIWASNHPAVPLVFPPHGRGGFHYPIGNLVFLPAMAARYIPRFICHLRSTGFHFPCLGLPSMRLLLNGVLMDPDTTASRIPVTARNNMSLFPTFHLPPFPTFYLAAAEYYVDIG